MGQGVNLRHTSRREVERNKDSAMLTKLRKEFMRGVVWKKMELHRDGRSL